MSLSATAQLTDRDRQQLMEIACQSLEGAVRTGKLPMVHDQGWSEVLLRPGAAFVTLHKMGELRGCIGSLQAWRPLATDVAENALAAALRDPRFPPVREEELNKIQVHISVLTQPEIMEVDSEQALLDALVPFEDGLILSCGRARATFLPSVWEQLPDPAEFVAHLKRKAGWPADFWSDSMCCERYRAISIGPSHPPGGGR